MDTDRHYAILSILNGYVRSPSLRHLRDPHSLKKTNVEGLPCAVITPRSFGPSWAIRNTPSDAGSMISFAAAPWNDRD
jgi:hypothetical protein